MNRGSVSREVRRQIDELGHMTYRNAPRGHDGWRCQLTGEYVRNVGTPRDVNQWYDRFQQRLRRLRRVRDQLQNQ
jgi:hypothetical protein